MINYVVANIRGAHRLNYMQDVLLVSMKLGYFRGKDANSWIIEWRVISNWTLRV